MKHIHSAYHTKAMNIFCMMVTKKRLATKVNAFTAQKSHVSSCTKTPRNQPYVKRNEVTKSLLGLSAIRSKSCVIIPVCSPVNNDEEVIFAVRFVKSGYCNKSKNTCESARMTNNMKAMNKAVF